MKGQTMAELVVTPTLPDPTPLTSHMIAVTRSDLREEFKAAVASLRDSLTARLDAIDVADRLLSENVNRVPTLLDREVATLRSLFESKIAGLSAVTGEKFDAVHARFTEVADRYRSDGASAKVAIQDALQAQKAAAAIQLSNTEAIGKSEDRVNGSLISLDRRIGDAKQSLDSGLSDLKNRMVSLETVALAHRENRYDTHSTVNLGLAGVVALGVGFAVFFGFASMHRDATPPGFIAYAPPVPQPAPRAP
jgi:hypothetical protein